MLFNSIHFLFFFPIVVFLFFCTPHRFRWILLLVSSYYFYMSWKVEYLVLILFSTFVSYCAAIIMEKQESLGERRKYLLLSIFVNLGVLFVFKYFNFFNETFQTIFSEFQLPYSISNLELLLPVGISFYTFQTLSYTIDVYRGQQKAERHLGIFALYVSFFPQLVAGPIERPGRLLPQFFKSTNWI